MSLAPVAMLAALAALPLAASAAPPQSAPLESAAGAASASPAPMAGSSRGEILAARQFGWLDLDHDGYLSRDEVALFPRLVQAFEQADADRDNRVSFDELRALALQRRAEKAAAAPQPAPPADGTQPPAPPAARMP